MNARTRALTFIFFSYVLLMRGTLLQAQTVVSGDGEKSVSAPKSAAAESGPSVTSGPTVISGAVVQNGADNKSESVPLPDQPSPEDALNGSELPYNATDEQASASVLGAAPTLKTPSPVHGLCWSNNNGYFALTEQNAIFIRDGFDSRLVHAMGYDGAVSLQFAWDVVTQSDMFMALSSGGKFSVWNFNDLPKQVAIAGDVEPSYSVELSSERRVTASAFSHSGNHMAVAYDDGTVNMSIVLHYTQKISDKNLSGHLGNVFALDFSKNDGFLVSSGLDDKLFIWNATDGSKVNSMPFYSGSGAGALFTPDSSAVISLERPDAITVRAFDGRRLMVIKPNGKGVKNFKLSSRGKNLIVLTGDDNLEFYDLETGKYVGYIPPFNQTTLTSYAFNRDDSVVLTGHADGSVYKLRLEKVFLKPGQKIPRMRMVGPDEVVVKGPGYTDKIPGSKDKGAQDIFKDGHEIFINPMAGTTPSPFSLSFGLDLGYKNFKIKKPFYLGGGLRLHFSPDFGSYPYTYYYVDTGEKLPNPFFLGGVVYGTLGIAFRPWKNNIVIFFDLNPGFSTQLIWNGKVGSEAITSDLFCSFSIASRLGMEFKRFNVAAFVEYDTLRSFIVGAEVGWAISFGGGKKKKNDK